LHASEDFNGRRYSDSRERLELGKIGENGYFCSLKYMELKKFRILIVIVSKYCQPKIKLLS
jgi:hypothetical protein